jgi:hypothetical protein
MADGTIKVEKIVTQILVMEAEVPVDAPVDVTNEAVEVELMIDEVQNVDVDDTYLNYQNKVN